MNRIFCTFSSFFILTVSLVLNIIPIDLSAQSPLKFPPHLEFKMYQNRQLIGGVNIFYTQDTGLKYFNRDISSLRWTLRPEGESNIKFMQEAYIFKDNLSLCHDAMISTDKGIYAETRLKEINQNERIFINEKSSSIQSDAQTSIDISRVSSLLVAAQKFSSGAFSSKEIFQYHSASENENTMKIIYVSETMEDTAHKNIPISIISITQQNKEVHRFKFFKDDNGYCYPVAIYFNINETKCLEFKLEKFPETQPTQNPSQTSVIYLDFIEANSQSLQNQNAVAKLVNGSIYNQIKKELNAAIIGSGKQLVLDMKNSGKLNTASQIKQLMDITFEQDTSIKEKIKKITGRFNLPAQADIIVTGQYVDNPGTANIMIRPVIILKNNPSIKTSNLMFNRGKLLCREPGTSRQILCQGSENYIAAEVRQFILPALQLNQDNQGLTIEGAYRMIIENQYFCHSQDYGYHYEVLEHLRELERIEKLSSVIIIKQGSGENSLNSYTFKCGWEIIKMARETNKKIVNTVSAYKSDYAKNKPLYWDIVLGSETTYDKALQMIEALNAANNEGHTDWRLPALEELFYIINDKNTYPFFLPFALPVKKANTIWTSTPLAENEKLRLTGSETDTYFVLRRAHGSRGEKVQFDVLEKDRTAFFIPVRSAISTGRQAIQSGHKGLTIANLAFMKISDHSPLISGDLGEAMNKAVNNGMNMAVVFNNTFSIIDGDQVSFTIDSNANLLANIFFNPNLSNEKKIRQIIENLMKPNKIDLLVTGVYIDDGRSDITVRPIVIYRYNQAKKTGNLQFRRTEFECLDSNGQKIICPQAAEQIARTIKKLLEQA